MIRKRGLGKGVMALRFILILSIFLGGFLTEIGFAAEPIKIGGSLSLTGKYAWTGNRMNEGYKVWEKIINERGYSPGMEKYGRTGPGLINGRPVEFIIYDDKSDPTTGIKLYQKLITSDKVDLLIGPYSSGVTKAISPVVERAEVPCVTSGASDTAIWKGKGLKWIVQGFVPTDQYSPGVAEIAGKRGAKTAALVFEDSAFAIALAESTKKHLENKGIKVLLFEPYPKGITDWTPPLAKAWALKPDVIGLGGYEPDAIGLTKAAQAIKATPKMFYWTVHTYSPHYVEAVGDACLAMMGEVSWDQSADTPGNQEYMELFAKIIGVPISQQQNTAAMGFFGCQLLEVAVKKAGSLNPNAVRDALYSMQVDTILGPYRVVPLNSEDSGMQTGAKSWIIQWQKKKPGQAVSKYKTVVGDYVREVVWPDEFKSADPIYPFPGWNR